MNIEANLRTYLDKRGPTTRYTSFDYCYNHFRLYRERGVLSTSRAGGCFERLPSCSRGA